MLLTGWYWGIKLDVWGIWKVQRGRGEYRGIGGDLSGRRDLEELGTDKIKLLKLIFEKQYGSREWTGLVWLSGLLMGCCEHGNEQLGLRNEGNYLKS